LRQRQGLRDTAIGAFNEALRVVPGHLCATAALGSVPLSPPRWHDPQTIDLAMAQAIGLASAAGTATRRKPAPMP
jgi:hypothetical protein